MMLCLALPSQLRKMMRGQGRDLHAESVRLLPTPARPIPIQRWTLRRVGLLAAMALLGVLVFNQGLSLDYQDAAQTPTRVGDLAWTALEPQWLLAQSVPSASLVPCVGILPVGWSFGDQGSGGRLRLDHRPLDHPNNPMAPFGYGSPATAATRARNAGWQTISPVGPVKQTTTSTTCDANWAAQPPPERPGRGRTRLPAHRAARRRQGRAKRPRRLGRSYRRVIS